MLLVAMLPLMFFGSTLVTCTINKTEIQNQRKNEENEFLPEVLADVCHVTVHGGIVGDTWSVCMKIQENYQRVQISYRKSKEKVVKCSKLGLQWIPYPDEIVQKERQIKVKCPDENDLKMCLINSNGSKADGGYLHFSVNENENGEWRELCSRYLVLKYMEYPKIITTYIDYMNRELLLMSDVVQTAEINASASFENVFLCPLHWKGQCDYRGQRYFHSCLGCNVSDEVINTISEMYGWNVEYPVTVVYTFPYGNRSTKTHQKLEIRNISTGTKDNNVLGTGVIVAICCAILLILIVVIILVFYMLNTNKCWVLEKSDQHNSNTAVHYNKCSKEEEIRVV